MRLITARLLQRVRLLLEGGACPRWQEVKTDRPPKKSRSLTANLPANADLNRNVTTVSWIFGASEASETSQSGSVRNVG